MKYFRSYWKDSPFYFIPVIEDYPYSNVTNEPKTELSTFIASLRRKFPEQEITLLLRDVGDKKISKVFEDQKELAKFVDTVKKYGVDSVQLPLPF